MKIRIKNYATFFGPYQFMDWLFWPLGKQGLFGNREYPEWHYNLSERYANSWLGTAHTWLAQKWTNFWNNRRVSIKLDKFDTWNMDHTLALIVAPMLKQLKETKHGAPFVDDEDVPEYLRSENDNGNDGDVDDNHFLRWDWVLDEMIFAFEQLAEDDWRDGLYTTEEGREEMKQIEARINNGTLLFGKYYYGLWD